MPLTVSQMSFAGGELNDLLVHRFELEPYALGARRLENFLVLESGAITRRPGTYHADDGSTKGNAPAYLFRWVYNDADAYVLEFTALVIRVYRDHGLVESAPGVPLEIVTPFTLAELPYLQVWQSGDVLWIRSSLRPDYKLTRTSHQVWTLTDASYSTSTTRMAFQDTNATAVTLRVSGLGVPGSPVVVTASSASLFNANYLYSYWRIDHNLPGRSQTEKFTGVATDTESLLVAVDAQWEFIVNGTGVADFTVELQASYDNSTWFQYRSVPIVSGAVNNWQERFDGANEEGEAIYLRAACTAYTSGTINTTVNALPYVHHGVVWLSFYSAMVPTQMSGFIVVTPASTDATADWAAPAWYGTDYPRALGFNSERLLEGGTILQPLTIHAGVAGDYDNFDRGMGDDADGWAITLSQSQQNRINWINGEWSQAIIVGTEGGVIELLPMSEGGFTPTNWPTIHRTLRRRTYRMQPLMVDDVLVVPGGVDAKRLYQIYHSTERGGLVAEDLTKFARHIAGTGFRGLFVQQDPDQILWLPRADGVLAGCSFTYGSTAWHRQVIGDEVISGCTVPTSDGDEVWLCVKRTVGATTMYFVEWMPQIDLEADAEDAYHVDGGESWDGGDVVTVTGITQANPAVITVSPWPQDSNGVDLTNTHYVRFDGIADLADQVFKVKTANFITGEITLYDETGTTVIDGTAFDAYTSGGTMEWVAQTLDGMDHFDGETLLAYADATEQDVVPASGTITLDNYYHTIHCGVEFTSRFESLPPEFYLRTGSTIGARKVVAGLVLSLYRSTGG
ncbi:MAG: hypothetical protein V2A79_16410, partial [Planctomycetota bacterium]